MAGVSTVDLRGLIPTLIPGLDSILDALLLLRAGHLEAACKLDGYESAVPQSVWVKMDQSEFEEWVKHGATPLTWRHHTQERQREDLKSLRAKLTFPRIDRAIDEIDQMMVTRIPAKVFAKRAGKKRVRGLGEAADLLCSTGFTSIAEMLAELQNPGAAQSDDEPKRRRSALKLKRLFWNTLEAALDEWEHNLNSERVCFEPSLTRNQAAKVKSTIGTPIHGPKINKTNRQKRSRVPSDEAKLRNKIETVIRVAKRIGQGMSDAELADELWKSGDGQGFKYETLRKILAGTYPPQRRLGIKGRYDR